MVNDDVIRKQISQTLESTHFEGLGERIQGKVRDSYIRGNERVLIATDRISAFDKVLTTIPFKGELLTQMARFWFELTSEVVPNHVVSYPDPSVMVAREVKIVPVEVVIRGYLTGSAWRDYEKGNAVSGIELPTGLRRNEKFDEPLLTPSTKAEQGEHDEPIAVDAILERGIVEPELWKKIEETAFRLFEAGTQHAASRGMILVDTKYEFGVDSDGRLVLADEVHTPDSSRYWYSASYEKKFAAGEDPENLDKEFVRKWLIEKGWMGDGDAPELDDDFKIRIAKRYIQIFEEITGKTFEAEAGSVSARIEANLKKAGLLG